MFAIISNLLILDGFTDYNNKFVTYENYICLVGNDKDMDEDGEFIWDKIEENYPLNFLFKISTDLDVPQLHINWKIDVNSFKLILNILDKMKVKIHFIVDLQYNWINIKMNFKLIYLDWFCLIFIVWKWSNYRISYIRNSHNTNLALSFQNFKNFNLCWLAVKT